MTRSRLRLRILAPCCVALAGLVLAGCSPRDGNQGTATAAVFPPRPVSVAADRIPPCSMLTPAQTAELNLGRPRPDADSVVNGRPSPACGWFGKTDEFDVSVQFIPIDASVAAGAAGATLTQVNGFGAVRDIPAGQGGPPLCEIAVDASAGQTIRVQVSSLPDSPITDDDLCRQAANVAAMVMTTTAQ